MKIGVASFFNPYEFRDILKDNNIPNINRSPSTATNLIVRGLLDLGHSVVVYTETTEVESSFFCGGGLKVYLISNYHKIPWMCCGSIILGRKIYKTIKSSHEVLDVMHGHWTYQYGYAVSKFAPKYPVFCTVRDWLPAIEKYMNGFTNFITWKICRKMIFKNIMNNNNIHLIANSDYIGNCISKMFPGRQYSIIYNPFSTNDVVPNVYQKEGEPVFATIAQNLLDPYKNISTLLKAFSIVKSTYSNAKLIMIGGINKESDEFKEWKKQSLLSGVEIKGSIEHNGIKDILKETATLVHPSLEESFGNVIIEGILNSNVVIGGANSGAVPLLLGGGEFGIILDVRDAKELARQMIYSISKEARKKYVIAAIDNVKKRFDKTVISKKHEELFLSYVKA